jgi:uncharacterized protein (UPF0548 family)
MGTRAVAPLDATTDARLRDAPFTYPEVGQTATAHPDGYHHLHRERVVGNGENTFRAMGESVLRWRVQLGSGLTIASPDNRVSVGTVGVVGIGIGPARLHAPVRVAYVVEDVRRIGFAYGTLPGHPVSGEELFCVEHRDDDSVVLVVAAFSRPQTIAARIAGPIGRLGQRLITARYLRSLSH